MSCLNSKSLRYFKNLFGREKYKSIAINLANDIFRLKGGEKIIDLEFLPVDSPPEEGMVIDAIAIDQNMYYTSKAHCAYFDAYFKAYHCATPKDI